MNEVQLMFWTPLTFTVWIKKEYVNYDKNFILGELTVLSKPTLMLLL